MKCINFSNTFCNLKWAPFHCTLPGVCLEERGWSCWSNMGQPIRGELLISIDFLLTVFIQFICLLIEDFNVCSFSWLVYLMGFKQETRNQELMTARFTSQQFLLVGTNWIGSQQIRCQPKKIEIQEIANFTLNSRP